MNTTTANTQLVDENSKKYLTIVIIAFIAMLTLFTAVAALKQYKEYRFVGVGVEAKNIISVSGEAEVTAVPDVAVFTASVRKEAKTTKEAQTQATNAINDIVSFLKEQGIAEKDMKTMNYSIQPRYEWLTKKDCISTPFTTKNCDRTRTLMGYTASQNIRVKVRDTNKAGDILAGVGSRGVDSVSGLSFEIDDTDALKAQARRKAIAQAKEKAHILANDLGVDIIRVSGFSEGGYTKPQPVMRFSKLMMADAVGESAPAPSLPAGENTIRSTVTITYEIR